MLMGGPPGSGKILSISFAGPMGGGQVPGTGEISLAQSRLTRWSTPSECRQYPHMDEYPPEP
jgi:ABC-type uncharacterized transport system YnjBCD ATPase subunit